MTNRFFIAAAGVVLAASAASAQSNAVPNMAVSFAGGVGSTHASTGAALGGSWLVDLNDRASLELQGTYLDRGSGTDAVSVNGSLLVNLLPARERVVPYAAMGAGTYRTSIDLANSALLGAVGSQFVPGDIICPAPGTGIGPGAGMGFGLRDAGCPPAAGGYWGVGHMPAFYARRLGPIRVPADGEWGTRSFTDPAVTLGGGIRFNATDRLMVRPEIRALVVFADGDTHTVAIFGVQLGYRF